MAQRQQQLILSDMKAAAARLDACRQTIQDKPEYSPLGVKFGGNQPGISQLNDPSFPSENDAALLAARFDEDAACWRSYISIIEAVAPAAASSISDYRHASQLNLADFLKGGVTWGEYLRRADALAQAARHGWRSAMEDMEQQLQYSHMEENALRAEQSAAGLRAVGAGLLNYSRPVGNRVTCMPFGTGVTCNQW